MKTVLATDAIVMSARNRVERIQEYPTTTKNEVPNFVSISEDVFEISEFYRLVRCQ